MGETGEKKDTKKACRLCSIGLRPFTKSSLLFYYAPAFGAVNYAALSVNVMNPALVMRAFPSRDITNVLLMNSMVGSALYVYNRPHLQCAPSQVRMMYSGYGALMFNFGSVLLWAVLRSVMPRGNCIATIVGLLSGCGLAVVGTRCLSYVDTIAKSPST